MAVSTIWGSFAAFSMTVVPSAVEAAIIRLMVCLLYTSEKLRFLDEPIDFGFWEYPGIGGMRMVVFSALLMLVIILWRRGIFGNKEFSWDSFFAFFQRLFARFKKKGVAE